MRKYKIVLVFSAGVLEDFNKAIEWDPRFAQAYDSRGTSKALLEDYKGALSDFTRAIDLDPQNPKPYYGSALARIILGNTESGCKDAKKSFDMGYARAEELLTKYCQ